MWPKTASVLGVKTCTSDRRLGSEPGNKKEPGGFFPLSARCGAWPKEIAFGLKSGRLAAKRRNLELILFPLTVHVKGNRTILRCDGSREIGKHG
jgi:hypothetical protein